MAELETKLTNPLAHMAQELATGSSGVDGAELAELCILALVNLRGDPEQPDFAGAVRQSLGLEPALQPNTFTRTADARCLWLGPDEWLIASESDAAAEIIVRLGAHLSGKHFSAVDVSAAYAMLQLSGRRAREVLAKACPLDLHPRVFRTGKCAQSNLARTQAILALESEAPVFRILVRRSYCEYLAQWLLDAMGEYREQSRLPHAT